MKIKFLGVIALSLLFFSCNNKNKRIEEAYEPILPVAVQKEETKKIYVHMMTWFGTNENNIHPEKATKGEWYGHWTMDTKNPDSIVDPATGRRDIAAHYYPLTGPYKSSDRNVIEYQLLLMKLAGIDGIIFNYTTLNPAWDFPMLISATDSIASLTERVGLDIAIMYEDQHVRDAAGRGELTTDSMSRAKMDMEYIKERYFVQPNYIKVNEKPMLLDFGPQYFTTEAEWTEVFSAFGEEQPAFYALNYHGHNAGKNAYGEFAWIGADNMAGLKHFYNTYKFEGDKMGVAYPGFHDFYKEGGWGNGYFNIPHRGDSTFVETLRLGLDADNIQMIQLATWNDYGEGTMIEPTIEFGYSFLTALQRELKVKNLSQKDLELAFTFYQARVKYADDAAIQDKLDTAFELMAALRLDEARNIIESVK